MDLRKAGDRASVVNLEHPYPVDSKIIMDQIARSLGLPVRTYSAWLEDLKRVKETTPADRKQILEEVPALKLIDFYQSLSLETAGGNVASDVLQLKLDVSHTLKLSQTLSSENVHSLGGDDVVKWLKGWNIST